MSSFQLVVGLFSHHQPTPHPHPPSCPHSFITLTCGKHSKSFRRIFSLSDQNENKLAKGLNISRTWLNLTFRTWQFSSRPRVFTTFSRNYLPPALYVSPDPPLSLPWDSFRRRCVRPEKNKRKENMNGKYLISFYCPSLLSGNVNYFFQSYFVMTLIKFFYDSG